MAKFESSERYFENFDILKAKEKVLNGHGQI